MIDAILVLAIVVAVMVVVRTVNPRPRPLPDPEPDHAIRYDGCCPCGDSFCEGCEETLR